MDASCCAHTEPGEVTRLGLALSITLPSSWPKSETGRWGALEPGPGKVWVGGTCAEAKGLGPRAELDTPPGLDLVMDVGTRGELNAPWRLEHPGLECSSVVVAVATALGPGLWAAGAGLGGRGEDGPVAPMVCLCADALMGLSCSSCWPSPSTLIYKRGRWGEGGNLREHAPHRSCCSQLEHSHFTL